MLVPLRTLLLVILMGFSTMALAQDINPDSLYGEYVTEDVREQLDKFKELEVQLQQQEKERERKKMVWYLILAGCAVSAAIVMGGISMQSLRDRRVHRYVISFLQEPSVCVGVSSSSCWMSFGFTRPLRPTRKYRSCFSLPFSSSWASPCGYIPSV